MARASKRKLLLDTGEMLFGNNGFTATGINQITQEAGIASMTLYNNFKSKDDLVLAVLTRTHQQIVEELADALKDVGGTPGERILALFDYMFEYASDESCRHPSDGSFTGYIFNHAASEFHPLSHPIHQSSQQHKQQLLDILERLAEEMKHPTPQALAQTLLLLIDGAFTSAQTMGDMSMFEHARNAANVLIEL